ncbi:hypothetical protein HK096_002001 [Nowakowskiella sp. JEL0078]|nr:hypothetical protein HK096_002001 [Nowakowskiella sp. JEL0078]
MGLPSSLFHNLTSNPVNWALFTTLVCLLLMLRSTPYTPPAPEHPGISRFLAISHSNVVELRNYTPKQLLEFDGSNNKKILFAVNGKVVDVTRGRSFYGPGKSDLNFLYHIFNHIFEKGGMYGNFAGRDASRGLAKNSFDLSMLSDPEGPIDKLEDLDEEEWQSLRDWAAFMENK